MSEGPLVPDPFAGDPAARLVVISAPSGAGKTTLSRRMLAMDPDLRFSVSHTTRPPRAGERHGEDYFFVSQDEFEALRDDDGFLEWAKVFDHYYGTGRAQVQQLIDAGHTVLLDIDWQGARQVRIAMPGSRSVFLLPPSLSELERRLRGRRSDSDATIRRRLQQAQRDISHWVEFDYVVINDDLDTAAAELAAVLRGEGSAAGSASPALRGRIEALFGA